jgi:hypothetical protein
MDRREQEQIVSGIFGLSNDNWGDNRDIEEVTEQPSAGNGGGRLLFSSYNRGGVEFFDFLNKL